MIDDALPLTVRALRKKYRHRVVLDAVTFEVRPGEAVALAGPNGAGKSTLIGCITADRVPDAGEVRICGADPFGQARAAAACMGFVPEQPFLYPELSVAELLRFVAAARSLDVDASAAETARLLALLGLAGAEQTLCRELSQGMGRKTAIAAALLHRPRMILLDEALNGLDANGRRAFLRALRRASSPRMGWILTSHRRADAHAVDATHLATLAHGRLERAGPVEATVQRPARPRVSGPGRANVTRRQRPRAARPLLRLEGAAIYRDGRAVIAPFDWTLLEGTHWLVRGANGSGKSTLMALVYGDLWPRHGGTLQRRWPAVDDWKRCVGLISPELQARYAATGCTVRDIVASGLHDSIGLNEHVTAPEARRVSRELARWGLRELADRRARELSYGQLRLVLAARAFVRRRRLYLLDEPFDGLDTEARARLRARLDGAVSEEGATLVLVSHHADDVPNYVRGELTLRRGRAPTVAVRSAARPRTRLPRRR